jgi:ADP-ribosylglycohydrolase
MAKNIKDAVFGAILGVAIGDALGVPVEFSDREKLKLRPVGDMMGFGAHEQPPGTWSDDTSLTLCLVDSLCNGYDLNDIADKFVRWYRDGLWTPHGYAFDRGATTTDAILNLMDGASPKESGGRGERDNGNGSLMRISPLIFYTRNMTMEERFKVVHEVSGVTHAHPRSLIACDYYVQFGIYLLSGMNREEAYHRTGELIKNYFTEDAEFGWELIHFSRILDGEIWKMEVREIQSHGYVVHTLEAALWSFMRSHNFREAVLNAVNLGHDTDTIGAVTGGIAGLYYGHAGIPEDWIEALARKDDILRLTDRFYRTLKNMEKISE